MVKLWERSSIAKIALKRGVQLTTSERMAEDLKVSQIGQFSLVAHIFRVVNNKLNNQERYSYHLLDFKKLTKIEVDLIILEYG